MKNRNIQFLLSLIMLGMLFLFGEQWYVENQKTVLNKQIQLLQKKPNFSPVTPSPNIFYNSTESIVKGLLTKLAGNVIEYQIKPCEDSISVSHLHIKFVIEGSLLAFKDFLENIASMFLFDTESLMVTRVANKYLSQISLTIYPVIKPKKMTIKDSKPTLQDFRFASLKFLGRIGEAILVQTPLGKIELIKQGQSFGVEKAFIHEVSATTIKIKLNQKIIPICFEGESCGIG